MKTWRNGGVATPFSVLALDRDQLHTCAAWLQKKQPRYLVYRRLGEPQADVNAKEREQFLASAGNQNPDSLVIQSVA
jgi:hypothetical protein